MSEHVDVAVIGMGPGGEVAASRLLAAGRRVAVIERELIGGECAYWACIPSKTVLRPPEAAGGVDRVEGAAGARLDWRKARDYRDYMARHLDDSGQVRSYTDKGPSSSGARPDCSHRIVSTSPAMSSRATTSSSPRARMPSSRPSTASRP